MKWENLRVDVPIGHTRNFYVEHFTVSEEDAKRFNLRLILNFQWDRKIKPGTYTRLRRRGFHDPIMSDTPAEISDLTPFFQKAKGNILINGLGLGVCLEACTKIPEVLNVTVIEISKEVIKLVGPHYQKKLKERLEIINADTLEWKPPKGVRYDVVWHDIWDNICADNLEQMKLLHRRYGKRCDWQGSWCRDMCEANR